jgi:cysteine-rich repeat protein
MVTGNIVNNFSDADMCLGMNDYMEWSCDNMNIATMGEYFTCPNNGTCEDGACVKTVDSPTCGNGTVEKNTDGSISETCDRGNENGTACTVPGNESNCFWCNSKCEIRVVWAPSCGNGKLETGEQCDDANHYNGDGCTAGQTAVGGGCQIEEGFACTGEPSVCSPAAPVCGNGKKEGTEACDSGQENGKVCTAPYGGTCKYCVADCTEEKTVTGPSCGDNTINGNEVCDDGTANGQACTAPYGGTCDYCKADCSGKTTVTGQHCGDGSKNGTEECDDGNQVNDDSCTNACKNPFCGDGIQQPKGVDGIAGNADDETCDDGNRIDDDTCDNNCKFVSPF